MRDLWKHRTAARLAGLLALLVLVSPAWCEDETEAQPAPAAESPDAPAAPGTTASEPSISDLLVDFVHYVNIDNVELAKANADAILARNIRPLQLVGAVEDSVEMQGRFEHAHGRALFMPGLEDSAAKLYMLYETGRRERARQPEEIERNIKMLTGTMGNRLFARDRLIQAKEYAVPYLVSVLIDSRDASMRAEAQSLLRDMGRDSVVPLTAALPRVGPEAQEQIALILGGIPYRTSLPYLYELRSTTQNEAVRRAVDQAVNRIDGGVSAGRPLGEMYRTVGDSYLSGTRSLMTFPGEDYQLLWSFEPALGLNATAIRSELFHEARAMELAEKALKADPTDEAALALWIAANFQREIDTPEDYENPVYGPERRDAMYYAVAAGPGPVQRVLERALIEKNTRLARRAIEALSRSAGGTDVLRRGEKAAPLVLALDYPDRRVQYEAALAIANSNVTTSFEGSDRVVPVLAAVIGQASARYAVVVAKDVDSQQRIRKVLEDLGYKVLAPAATLEAQAAEIVGVPGVDVVVIHDAGESAIETIERIRADARLGVTPVLALMPLADAHRLEPRLKVGSSTEFRGEGVNDAQLATSIEALVTRASGPAIDGPEGEKYSLQAIEALERLAVSGSTTMDVGAASQALMTALGDSEGEVKLRLAGLMAYVCRPGVQASIVEAALAADGDERVQLLDAASQSAKRCGNQMPERLVSRVIEMANTATGEEATGASALLGSMSLPNERVVPLIVGEAPKH